MAKTLASILFLFISDPHSVRSACSNKMTKQQMLGVPESCDLISYEGCENKTASGVDITSKSPTLVICEVSHMCILVKEDYMFEIWTLPEDDALLAAARWRNREGKQNPLYPDGTCQGFDLNGAVVGRPGEHHWMFCLQKACEEELNDPMADGDIFYDCETRTESNSTHVTFSNEIHFPTDTSIQQAHSALDFGSTKAKRLVPIQCTWQTGFFKSSPVIFFDSTTIILIIPGTQEKGRFEVTMKLHKDDTFSSPYTTPPQLSGTKNERLNVELDITGLDVQNAGVRPKLTYLWVSLSEDPMDLSEAIFLVWDECEQYDGMVIHMNGDEDLVRVVAPVVGWAKFMGASGNLRSCNYINENNWNCQVYLHGYVNVCSPYYPNSSCFKKTCTSRLDITDSHKSEFVSAVNAKVNDGRTIDIVSRKRRSIASTLENGGSGNHLLSLGPFGISSGERTFPFSNKEQREIEEQRRQDEFVWRMQHEIEPEILRSFWIGVILTVCSVIFIIVVLTVVFYYKVWVKRV